MRRRGSSIPRVFGGTPPLPSHWHASPPTYLDALPQYPSFASALPEHGQGSNVFAQQDCQQGRPEWQQPVWQQGEDTEPAGAEGEVEEGLDEHDEYGELDAQQEQLPAQRLEQQRWEQQRQQPQRSPQSAPAPASPKRGDSVWPSTSPSRKSSFDVEFRPECACFSPLCPSAALPPPSPARPPLPIHSPQPPQS